MHRTRTTPVPATRARLARRAAAALVAVALAAPAAADARVTDSAAGSGAAPRAAIGISQLMPGSLSGVAATSAKNAWAVGNAMPGTSGLFGAGSPLILHWDGAAWTRQATPAMPANQVLLGVAARSAKDAWAVGRDGSGLSSHAPTVILHWNGAAWSLVATPAVGQLSAVAMLSARNAWAVGGFPLPVVLHWNGHLWARVRLPKLPAGFVEAGFSAVSARSSRDVWAVGSMTNCGCGPGSSLVMHWNGRSWKRLKQPAPSRECCFALGAVAAVSSRRAFVVGHVGEGVDRVRAQAARFNGRRWRRQPTPSPGFHQGGEDVLGGVAATSSANGWAVGSTFAANTRVLVERWNGRAWRQAPVTVSLAPAVPHADGLRGVTARSDRDAWAVGAVTQTANGTSSALILHWNGAGWSAVPTAP